MYWIFYRRIREDVTDIGISWTVASDLPGKIAFERLNHCKSTFSSAGQHLIPTKPEGAESLIASAVQWLNE